jgi:hypothetical protein
MATEMVIFTRAYDLLVWLLHHTEKWPRAQRFVVTKRALIWDRNSVRGEQTGILFSTSLFAFLGLLLGFDLVTSNAIQRRE